jgi:hypothetical protein
MTDEDLRRIKDHIEVHAKREPRALIITRVLQRAVAELEKEKWHFPLKGELPKEDKEYLVYMNDGTIDIQEITMDGDGHYYFNGISWAFDDLIAWRELPEPPKEEE